jgi:MoxR-like ATPase
MSEEQKIIERLSGAHKAMFHELHKVIVGQSSVLEQLLIALFCGGHCLMIGVPGLAKTLMVSTLAQVLSLSFKRIQFTPDLMPTDITGTDVMEEDAQGRRAFRFIQGPVFANIVLADEINRTPPKTQSALLEAMQEHSVTAGGQTYPLPKPFFVLATQNPIEQEGTYPLPEAQLDRFMFSVNLGYPSRDEERTIVKATTYDRSVDLHPVLDDNDILQIQHLVRRVPASDHVINYAVDLVRASRPHEPEAGQSPKDYLAWGAGPRASQALILGAKARAILHHRYAVAAKDVRAMAGPVLRHRMFTNFNADAEGKTPDDVIHWLLENVKEPGEAEYPAASAAASP